ncbi:hypothetical protein KSP40_PGU019665 [Platanthera guangdongensis]|uniref:Reverse transcriptase zinc-binding domain-containing protein n=1 Tax=Platanthera guangdongensis TaxID=2320717 RepID=A0ABR2LC56_9ASPA
MFWWRLLWDAIPTRAWLARRGLTAERGCPWVYTSEDTWDNLVSDCCSLSAIQSVLLRWGYSMPSFSSWDTVLELLPPPPRWINFNVDGSLFPFGLAGLGMVACDDLCALIFTAGSPLLLYDPGGVEMSAILALRNLISPSLYGVRRLLWRVTVRPLWTVVLLVYDGATGA